MSPAPDDYTAVDMILTFRQGADGSRPSDAVCVEVPIIDDIDAEERERLTFRIEAVDQDRIRVDESLAEKVLYIEDNDGIVICCTVNSTREGASKIIVSCIWSVHYRRFYTIRNPSVYPVNLLDTRPLPGRNNL